MVEYIPFPRIADFVNRAHELNQLAKWAKNPNGKILSIVGMGGAGKTALLVEFLYREAGTYFPDGVFWINGRNSLVDELARIAEHHGIKESEVTTSTARAHTIVEKIARSKRALLVFDDLDRPNLIYEGEESLPPLASLGAAIATTSRLRLTPSPDILQLALANLDFNAAATLLVKLAGPNFSKSRQDGEHLQSLVHELGGHALAIALAGNLAKRQELTSGDLLTLFRENKEQLREGVDLAKPLHDTLQRAHDSIPDDFTRDLLTILCFLPTEYPMTKKVLPLLYGGINEVALVQMDKALRWLESLSLVSIQEYGTVRIHPLVRSYVREITSPAKVDRLASNVAEIARTAVTQSTSDVADRQLSTRALKVFLCYAGPDRPIVEKLYERLCSDGFSPWMDKHLLLPGQDWEIEVEHAIHGADFFVACISKRFVGRTYGHKEIRQALAVYETMPEGAIYLIPARIEEVPINDRRLKSKQWVDLFERDGYERLVSSMRGVQSPSQW
jgi:hypothetical protein